MRLTPARRINGHLRLPGDKSISHRAALIASLAPGISRLSNFSSSHDCASTLSCLQQLGVSVSHSAGSVTIEGRKPLGAPAAVLDCGNSGSTMRILSGVLAGQEFRSELAGDDSLSSRPMKRIIEPLELMGARIDATNGKPPLKIQGSRQLNPITYQLPVASAQVKSCILFAGLNATGRTTVIESSVTRDHTERLFNGFGVTVTTTPNDDGTTAVAIHGPAQFTSGDMTIPGDVSSAAYFAAAATLLPQSDLVIEAASLNPTRTAYLSVLRDWGARITNTDIQTERNEPRGTIHVEGTESLNHAVAPRSLPSTIIPSLIDELPLMAVIGTQLSGGLEIRNASELRFKEADRIMATVSNLRSMGAEVEEYDDGLFVNGPVKLRAARIDSFGDHRIAMAFSIAALIADGPTEIAGASCVNISFPEFFELLQKIAET
jgi:3-phosphoshikimate 1-carboxyvinyltransferase